LRFLFSVKFFWPAGILRAFSRGFSAGGWKELSAQAPPNKGCDPEQANAKQHHDACLSGR
jgi:hypothetical protein